MRRLGSLIAVSIVISACGGATATTDGVIDFIEIAVGDPQFVFDPSATSARLEVETTVRTICAVAFGDTEDLGELATDQDMDAAGHQDHGPLLTGLRPNNTYFYRLQGVGPDGTLYQSGLLTFETPAAEARDDETNLAVSATVVEVSSEFSSSFAAANAFDGDPVTEWASLGDGDGAYVVIDLGEAAAVAGIRFVTREMSDGSSIATSYTVIVDGDAVYGPFEAGLDPPLIDVEFSGQVLRFTVESSTGGNTGAVEIEVYGP